jgi:hypothetical protein
LISCRQATSGAVSSSHSTRRGSRPLTPLTLKLAILLGASNAAVRRQSAGRTHYVALADVDAHEPSSERR